MLRLPIALLVAVVSMSTVVRARAAIINSSMVIDASNSFPGETVDVVDGANPPTVVDVVAGGVAGGQGVRPDMIARGRSRINLLGGGQFGSEGDQRVEARANSQVVVYAKYDSLGIGAYDAASVKLTPGANVGGIGAWDKGFLRAERVSLQSVFIFDEAEARLIDCDGPRNSTGTRVEAVGRSTLLVREGVQEDIILRDDSVLWMTRGAVTESFAVTDRSQLHLLDMEGDASEQIGVYDDATIHFYGTDLKYEVYDDGEPPAVTGVARSGRFHQPMFMRGNARIVFHTVPEPATAATFALGVLSLAAARRRLASR